MFQKSILFLGCFLVSVFLLYGQTTQNKDLSKLSGDQILMKMIEKTKSINTIIYRLDKKERIKGKFINGALFIKLSVEPFKIYTRMYSPKEGMEVLYNSQWEKKKAVINTNSFPWVSVKFHPLSKTMRKNQHHTILDSGFDKIVSSIEYQYKSSLSEGKEMCSIKGMEPVNGDSCWILEFENPSFKFQNYVVKEGEDLVKIANKLGLSDYMILEYNKDIRNYYDVEAGQHIKVPSSYSKKMILYVDSKTYMPLIVEAYDAKGLYEQFIFRDLKLNVQFDDNEFSTDYKEYNF